MLNYYRSSYIPHITTYQFEEGSEAAGILENAMRVRDGLGDHGIRYGNTQTDSAGRQLQYLQALNELPFTKHIASRTRELMRLDAIPQGMCGSAFENPIADIGSAYCPDMFDIMGQPTNRASLYCYDINENMLTHGRSIYIRSLTRDRLDNGQLTNDVYVTFAKQDVSDPNFFQKNAGCIRRNYFAVREIRTLQQTANPLGMVCNMVKMTRPGGHIVCVDPDWTDIKLNGVDTDLAEQFKLIASYSDTGKSYGVMHADVAKRSAGFLRLAGAVDVKEEMPVLKTNDKNRIYLASGLPRKLRSLTEMEHFSEATAGQILQDVSDALDNGAYMTFPYHISHGVAPAPSDVMS